MTALVALWIGLGVLTLILRVDGDPVTGDSIQSLEAYLHQNLTGKIGKIIRERREARRKIQRDGYSSMLLRYFGNDGIGALFAYARMEIIMGQTLPHDIVWLIRPVPPDGGTPPIPGIPFVEDWTFPSDPWTED